MQILLGGWTSTNYAALACNDFPTCHGKWLPDMDFENAFHVFRNLGEGADGKPLTLAALSAIQWIHRIGALVTFVYLSMLGVAMLKHAPLKSNAITLLVLLTLQVLIGVANLILHLPTALAVAHNAGAALLVITIITINSKVSYLAKRG